MSWRRWECGQLQWNLGNGACIFTGQLFNTSLLIHPLTANQSYSFKNLQQKMKIYKMIFSFGIVFPIRRDGEQGLCSMWISIINSWLRIPIKYDKRYIFCMLMKAATQWESLPVNIRRAQAPMKNKITIVSRLSLTCFSQRSTVWTHLWQHLRFYKQQDIRSSGTDLLIPNPGNILGPQIHVVPVPIF